jgi:hypothetical protein
MTDEFASVELAMDARVEFKTVALVTAELTLFERISQF